MFLKSLTSGEMCVTRGLGYRLGFKTLFNKSSLSSSEQDTIIQVLKESVHDAPWWSEIPGSSSIQLMGSHDTSVADFWIKIGFNLPDKESDDVCSDLESMVSDLQAPDVVRKLQLERVVVVLEFFSSPLNESIAKDKQSKDTDTMLFDIDYANMSLQMDNLHRSQHEEDDDDMLSIGNVSVLDMDELLGDSEGLIGCQPNDVTLLITPQASSDIQLSSSNSNSSSSLLTNLEQRFSSTSTEAAIRLVDTALRTLIGGQQFRVTPGINLCQPKPQPLCNLSGIAPLLWNPGFNKRMSLRSKYVSTIASVFSHTILKNSQSPSLRSKLLNLSERNMPPNSGTKAPAVVTIQKTNKEIQGKLWRMMHLSLYGFQTGRRLKSRFLDTEGIARMRQSATYVVGSIDAEIGNSGDDVKEVDNDANSDMITNDGFQDGSFNFENTLYSNDSSMLGYKIDEEQEFDSDFRDLFESGFMHRVDTDVASETSDFLSFLHGPADMQLQENEQEDDLMLLSHDVCLDLDEDILDD